MTKTSPLLISACLLGVRCRYDGGDCLAHQLEAELRQLGLDPEQLHFLPVCPEQLGGLPTPRPPATIQGGHGCEVLQGSVRVTTRDGEDDVTQAYLAGARQTLQIAEMTGARHALLKSKSPSCAVGSFRHQPGSQAGDGVTAALLKRAGLRVVELDAPSRKPALGEL